MIEFQNNFTTPEQSKRLLELGVPADSADCILFDESEDVFSFKKYHHMVIELPAYEFHKQSMISGRPGYLPCWSVGRLIEIYLLCVEESENIVPNVILFKGDNKSSIENLIEWFETESMDFSKL